MILDKVAQKINTNRKNVIVFLLLSIFTEIFILISDYPITIKVILSFICIVFVVTSLNLKLRTWMLLIVILLGNITFFVQYLPFLWQGGMSYNIQTGWSMTQVSYAWNTHSVTELLPVLLRDKEVLIDRESWMNDIVTYFCRSAYELPDTIDMSKIDFETMKLDFIGFDELGYSIGSPDYLYSKEIDGDNWDKPRFYFESPEIADADKIIILGDEDYNLYFIQYCNIEEFLE